MENHLIVSATKVFVVFTLSYVGTIAQAGSISMGDPIVNLTPAEMQAFQRGLQTFQEIDSVTGTEPGAAGKGLGPRFNSNSCVSCHASPSAGGSSPTLNPQVHLANQFGAKNKVPFFISENGPVREARFKYNADGSRDGGVHGLYVISGRADAGRCNIVQPDFAKASQNNNLIFRIPTPLFGAGLIEQISDSAIVANKLDHQKDKLALGISGHENHNGNDGTISRFGWKAQNKSLALFAAEAYNAEQGVTNEIFPTERDETVSCAINATPEDHTNHEISSALDGQSDVAAFTTFMRYLAPPPSVIEKASPAAQLNTRRIASISEDALPQGLRKGAAQFATIGCAACHTPSLTTGASSTYALSNIRADLFSDLLVHHMGPDLADDIIQGEAGPDEFRTAPLWGLGKRLFYLHDGRTNNLTKAIEAHASGTKTCAAGQATLPGGGFCASEANQVVKNFKALSDSQKNDLLTFLKAL